MILIAESELNALREQLREYQNAGTEGVKPEPRDPIEIRVIDSNQNNELSIKNKGKALSEIEEQVIEALPKSMVKRGMRILTFLKQHSNVLSISDSGGLIINNQEILGSNMTDLLSDLMLSLNRKFQPTGLQPFLRVLAMIHFPLSFVVNRKNRAAIVKYKKQMPNNTKRKNHLTADIYEGSDTLQPLGGPKLMKLY